MNMAITGQRSKVEVDYKNNRLLITICGVINHKDIESIYTEIRFGVADLKPGFAVITDLREGRIGHLKGIPTFHKIAQYLLSKEVGKIIRITNQPHTLFKQVAKLTAKLKGYEPVYVKNMEEVEEILKEE